jgi:hypothetical protein
MKRWLVLAILSVGCTKSKPLPEAILGSWEVLCYTDEPTSSCLSKEKNGLHKTFQPGGVLDVRRPDEHQPSSDVTRWTVEGEALTITVSGGGITLVENWRALIHDDRLVLWDPEKQIGEVLGRVGASFEAADSPISRGGQQPITLNGQTFTIELPGGYRQTRSDTHQQHWGPESGDGFVVRLSVTPRVQHGQDGEFVTPPCNSHDYGGVVSSAELVDGVERETAIGTGICLEGTELALMCSTAHTRGHLEPSEKEAALALCKTIRR